MILDLPNGAHVVCDVYGDGEPILLLSPLAGSRKLWGPLRDQLASELRVITYDPRGIGASSDVPLGFTTKRAAGDAELVLDALGIDRAFVLGLSFGGMVAMWISPTRVRDLILASTLPAIRTIRHRETLSSLARAFLKSNRAIAEAVLSPQFRHREILELVEPSKRRNRILLALAAALHHNPQTIEPRTLVVYGACDPIAGAVARESLLLALPWAEIAVIPGAGHDLSLEAPDQLAEHVLHFVRRATPV